MFSLDSFITDVSIFCLRSRHSNRRSHQCIFLHLFYVKITLFNKDKMLEKVLKIKNFHPFSRCSNTTHSTCCICRTQKVWVILLRINCVLPTSSHTRRAMFSLFVHFFSSSVTALKHNLSFSILAFFLLDL